jgi:hypothetical protein
MINAAKKKREEIRNRGIANEDFIPLSDKTDVNNLHSRFLFLISMVVNYQTRD